MDFWTTGLMILGLHLGSGECLRTYLFEPTPSDLVSVEIAKDEARRLGIRPPAGWRDLEAYYKRRGSKAGR